MHALHVGLRNDTQYEKVAIINYHNNYRVCYHVNNDLYYDEYNINHYHDNNQHYSNYRPIPRPHD